MVAEDAEDTGVRAPSLASAAQRTAVAALLAGVVAAVGGALVTVGGTVAGDGAAIRALGGGGPVPTFALETVLGPLAAALPLGNVSQRLAFVAVGALALFAREVALGAATFLGTDKSRPVVVPMVLAGAFAAFAPALFPATVGGSFAVFSLLLLTATVAACAANDHGRALPIAALLLGHEPVLGLLAVGLVLATRPSAKRETARSSPRTREHPRTIPPTETLLRAAACFGAPLIAALIVGIPSPFGAEGEDLFRLVFGGRRPFDAPLPTLLPLGLLPLPLALLGLVAAARPPGTAAGGEETARGTVTALRQASPPVSANNSARRCAQAVVALAVITFAAPRFAPIPALSGLALAPIALLAPFIGLGIVTLGDLVRSTGVRWADATRLAFALLLLAVIVRDVDRTVEKDGARARTAVGLLLAAPVPTGTLLLGDDAPTDRFLAASRLRGELGHDLIVLPLRALGGRRATRWSAGTEGTAPHLRTALLGNVVLQGFVAARTESELATVRPIASLRGNFLDPKSLRTLVPGGPIALIAPEPRGPSDRLSAARAFLPIREAAAAALHDSHDEEATRVAQRLLRARLLLLAALADRDPLAAAIDDLRRLAPEDRLAAEATKRMLLNRAVSLSDFAGLVRE